MYDQGIRPSSALHYHTYCNLPTTSTTLPSVCACLCACVLRGGVFANINTHTTTTTTTMHLPTTRPPSSLHYQPYCHLLTTSTTLPCVCAWLYACVSPGGVFANIHTHHHHQHYAPSHNQAIIIPTLPPLWSPSHNQHHLPMRVCLVLCMCTARRRVC
jgi:hypothetical protein